MNAQFSCSGGLQLSMVVLVLLTLVCASAEFPAGAEKATINGNVDITDSISDHCIELQQSRHRQFPQPPLVPFPFPNQVHDCVSVQKYCLAV